MISHPTAHLILAISVTAFTSSGCDRNPAAVKPPGKPRAFGAETAASAPSSQMPAGAPVTDEEAMSFARSVESALRERHETALLTLVDWEELLHRATWTPDETPALRSARAGFTNGLEASLMQPGGLVRGIADIVANGGSYSLLRIHSEGGVKRALFRMTLSETGGLNYHDYVLERRAGGQVRAVDIYIFSSAEPLSQTLRRAFLPVVAQASRGLIGRFTDTENEFIRNAEALRRLGRANVEQRSVEALQIYRELPESLQRDKSILLIRLRAAQRASADEYAQAIKAFHTFHSNDPCLDFISIDGYAMQGDFPKAIEAIGRVNDAVGGTMPPSISCVPDCK
jgi:hypothetical protein